MNVTREVILDLLPVYLSGEASPATRALVEEYLKQDEELAVRIRLQWQEGLARAVPSPLPPDLELRTLKRTRALLGWQRWIFGLAITFTALSLTSQFSGDERGIRDFHFLIQDYPGPFGTCLAIGAALWVAYYVIRKRLRAG